MSTFVPSTNLYSTAPYTYQALLNLCTAAGALANPYVYVAPFELEQYEPGQYVICKESKIQRMEIETLGRFRSMQEWYDTLRICESCLSATRRTHSIRL